MGQLKQWGGALATLADNPRAELTAALHLEVSRRLAKAKREKAQDDGVKVRDLTQWFPVTPYVEVDTLFAGAVVQYRQLAPQAGIVDRSDMRNVLYNRLTALEVPVTGVNRMLDTIDGTLPRTKAPAAVLGVEATSVAVAPVTTPTPRAAPRKEVAEAPAVARPAPAPRPATKKPSLARTTTPRQQPMQQPYSIAEGIVREFATRKKPANHVTRLTSPAPAPVIFENEKPGANPWGLPVEWAGDEVLNRIARNFEGDYRGVSGQRAKAKVTLLTSLEQAGLNAEDVTALSTQLIVRMDARLGLAKLGQNRL